MKLFELSTGELWWLVGVGAMACVAFSIGLTGWPMPLVTFFFR